MKKRFSAFLLAALMLAALLPVTSMAADPQEIATLDDLKTAVDNGGEYKLTANVQLTERLTVTKDLKITADSAKEITTSYNNNDAFEITGGTLTLGANITITAPAALAITGGEVILDGAVLIGTHARASVVEVWNTGKLTINDGEIRGTQNGTTLVVGNQCDMYGGKVTSVGTNVAIVARKDSTNNVIGKVTIYGGEVLATHSSAAVAREGATIEVKGGTVKTTCTDPAYMAVYCLDASTLAVSGGTVEAAAGIAIGPETNNTAATITISGGTIKGGYADVYNAVGGTFTISGGSFSQEIPSGMGITIVPPPVYGGPVMNWVKVNAAENGVVKSGPLAASAGATITLYPKASEGYVLDTVEVLDAEGNAVQLDGMKFQVPLGGVTVNATFKLAE